MLELAISRKNYNIILKIFKVLATFMESYCYMFNPYFILKYYLSLILWHTYFSKILHKKLRILWHNRIKGISTLLEPIVLLALTTLIDRCPAWHPFWRRLVSKSLYDPLRPLYCMGRNFPHRLYKAIYSFPELFNSGHII